MIGLHTVLALHHGGMKATSACLCLHACAPTIQTQMRLQLQEERYEMCPRATGYLGTAGLGTAPLIQGSRV